MEKFKLILIIVSLVAGSILTAGCTSLFNLNDLTFLSSLQEFQNESMTRIGQIDKDVKLEQWDAVKTDLSGYQGVIKKEIDHLNSLQVSEKVVPIREQAVVALKKQETILQSVQDLPEINATVIPSRAGDYLAGVIESAMTSALSGKK